MTIDEQPLPYELLGWGEVGIVCKISDDICLKFSVQDNEEHISNEHRIFDLLSVQPRCPHMVQSFIRLPTANFLQYLGGGTLDQRLRLRQKRDPTTDQVLAVEERVPQHLALRWMAELADAAAWLESLGYAHADIRPQNLLLDKDDHLKLADFDNTAAVGSLLDVGVAPYARVLGDEGGKDRGSLGYLGLRTEQFAIGSIFYYIIRGYEPYDNEWFGQRHGPETVRLLQKMALPSTDNIEVETIVHDCWHGKFESIRDLAATVRLLDGLDGCKAEAMSEEEYTARQQECKRLMAEGILDKVKGMFQW